MAINVKENKKDAFKVEILDADNTLAGALKAEIWNDKSTKVTGYNIKHSLADNPILVVKGKEAKKIVIGSVKRCIKRNKEFLSEFKRSVK